MNKIYIGNLPPQTTEDMLRPLFTEQGEIKSIRLIKDRYTGELRGFGFVEFGTQAQAQAALSLDGQTFQGKTLKVSIAQERRPTSNTGTGGGFNSGRRRSFNDNGGNSDRRRW